MREEHGQPVREVQSVAQPLNAVDEDSHRAGVENRLQGAADVDSQQEHQVHHKQEYWQTEEAVKDNFIHRRGEAAWLSGQGVTDGIAYRGDTLIAGIGDIQRRIVHLAAQVGQRQIQFVGGVAGKGAAINIAFQHLQPKPAALTQRHISRHRLRQHIGFALQGLRIVHQFQRLILLMAVKRHFQRFDAATAGGDQRNHRAAETGRQRVDVDADLLFFGNIEHV